MTETIRICPSTTSIYPERSVHGSRFLRNARDGYRRPVNRNRTRASRAGNDARDKSASINLRRMRRPRHERVSVLFISIGRHRPFTRCNYAARWSIVELDQRKPYVRNDPQLGILRASYFLFLASYGVTSSSSAFTRATGPRRSRGPDTVAAGFKDNYTIDMLNISRLNHVDKRRRRMVNWISREITDAPRPIEPCLPSRDRVFGGTIP